MIQQQTNHDSYKQEDVALRLLAFGQESSDMLGSIHTVIDDTIQRAESWLERLRLINPISSLSSHQLPVPLPANGTIKVDKINNDDDFYNILLPPILNLHISSASAASAAPSTTTKI